ncbi:4906_t:CDS:2, partial [Funneliformis geosporum]
SVGIDANNCPDKNLKHFLLEIEDILEKQTVEVFKNVSNVMVNMPSFDHFDTKGNTEEGKKILAEIANSFSSEERENFHFYPSFTSEEKAEYEKEQKEGKKSDPITKGQRINAIEEIKNALQKELKLANHDLDPENQDWENEINRTEKIMEIEKVKRRVLADIEKKRHQKKTNQTSISNENDNKFPLSHFLECFQGYFFELVEGNEYMTNTVIKKNNISITVKLKLPEGLEKQLTYLEVV